MNFSEIVQKNKEITFYTVSDASQLFRKVEGNFDDIIALSAKLKPESHNQYIAGDNDALALNSVIEIGKSVFAELPIQSGWCFGGNIYMNGMEWHKSSEVVIACTDCVLLLGDYGDIVDGVYDSAKAVGLYLQKGEAVELLPMTLHLAPLPRNDIFIAAIILPQGTNLPLKSGIEASRRAINKWLLVHPENIKGIASGGAVGITGKNIYLNKQQP